jgi:hypothetical protein
MDEFDQDGAGHIDADEQDPVSDAIDEQPAAMSDDSEGQVAETEGAEGAEVVEGETGGAEAPEPREVSSPIEDEHPTVQESMSFDEIVASAAAAAVPPVAAAAEEGEAESAGEGAEMIPPSEDLDDMVDALKEGAAAKAAEGEGTTEGEEVVAERLDDEAIAEEAQSEEEALEEIEDEYAGPSLARNRLGTKLPAWIYAGVWVVFLGVMVYLLWPVAGKSFVNLPDYAYMVIGGLALAVAGPLIALGTWLFARMGTTASERIGLVRAVWMRCMMATVFGVAVWWIALFALDLHRTGSLG